MSDNIFGSNIPDGLTLNPAANSSDDKYVQGTSPTRSATTSNPDTITKSGFYYGTSGTLKNVIHSHAADGTAYQISNDSASGVYLRTKSGSVWSPNKFIVTRDGNQYIQSITTDDISALKIPQSTVSVTTASQTGIKYQPNANAALTNDMAVGAMFKPNGVDSNYPGGGYGVSIIAPSQSGRIGVIEVNEFGKVYSTYGGWFHENYLNKVNATSGTYTVNTGPGTVAMRFIGNGMGPGTQIEVEGSFDPSNPVTTSSGASIAYHKPGVVRWKSGVCTGIGEVYDNAEYHFRTGFDPGSTQGTLRMAIGLGGHIWTSAYGHLHDKFFYDPNGRLKNNHWGIFNGYIEVFIDGVPRGINFFTSDERLKNNIKPTKRDSLNDIKQIDFKSFKYNDERFGPKELGVIAQQIEKVNPEWVNTMSDGHKMPDSNDLLVSALHAIQQLNKKVEELENKLENK